MLAGVLCLDVEDIAMGRSFPRLMKCHYAKGSQQWKWKGVVRTLSLLFTNHANNSSNLNVWINFTPIRANYFNVKAWFTGQTSLTTIHQISGLINAQIMFTDIRSSSLLNESAV